MPRLFKGSIFFIVLTFFVFLTKPAFAADWPTFRGDPGHSGVSTESVSVPLEKKWDYPIGYSFYSSPIVASGTAFVGSRDSYVYAIATSSGTLNWRYQTGGEVDSTPLFHNGKVYIGSSDGIFSALDASTGSLAWSFDAKQGGDSNPIQTGAVTDGTNIYFPSGRDRIFALNATTGTLVWQYDVPGGFSNPSAALILSRQYNALFIGSEEGVVYAINTDGTTKWTYQTTDNGFSTSSPAVVGGVVYIGSDNGIVYALNAGNGTLDWSYSVGSDILSSPAVTGSTLYIGSMSGNVYALRTTGGNKGSLKWSYRLGNAIRSSAVVSGNLLYVGADNLFVALDASNGNFKWSYGVEQYVASPAISNGIVYVASDRLYAFEETTALAAMIQKWQYDTGSTISMSGTAVDGGVTYVGADDGNLYAIDNLGILKWKYNTNTNHPISTTPAVSSGVVYFGARTNQTFYAVNTADGTLKWSKNIGPTISSEFFVSSTPTVVSGVVYLGAYNGKAYALNATTGATIWEYDTTSASFSAGSYNLSSIVIDSGNAYFSYAHTRVVSLNATTGVKNWEYTLVSGRSNIEGGSSILLNSGVIYAGGGNGIYAVNVVDGTLKWFAPTDGIVDPGVVLWNNVIIAGTRHNTVYAVDASTGSLLWSDAVGSLPGMPFIWEDMVFVMAGNQLYVLAADTGQIRHSIAGNYNPLLPVVTGGILYAGLKDGRIYSFDIDNYSMPTKAALGGTILTVYGDRLVIPPGALSADTTITISIAPNDQSTPGVVALPRKYRFGPDGTTFAVGKPVTAKFAYKTSDLQGADPSTVKVYVYDSTTSTWSASGGSADTVNKTINVSLNHFSDYALFGGVAPELNFPILSPTYIYGTPVTLNFSAFDPAIVTSVQGYFNDQPIASGTQVILTKLGINTFRVEGAREGGGTVSQSISFEVLYALEWLSPLANKGTLSGDTLPIKFALQDINGKFVQDNNVAVQVIDDTHATEIFDTAKEKVYIKVSENHYLINLSNKDYPWIVPGGTYKIKVSIGPIVYPPYSFALQ